MEGLGQRAFYGSLQMMAAQAVKFVAQIVSVIILARLVAPEEFGIIAFITSVFVFVNLLSDFGLSFAIVQKEEITETHLNKIFQISLWFALVFFLLITLSGFATSYLTNDPKYSWIISMFGAAFFLKALSIIPQGLLRRRLQFGFLAIQEATSFMIGTVLSIWLAAQGKGLLALMTIQFAPVFLSFTSGWIFSGWKPGCKLVPIKEIKTFFAFGGSFTLVEFANTICKHLDNILIGKFWGMEILGQYNRAYALMLAPLNQIMGPIGAVIIPSFSRMHHKKEEFERLTKSLLILFVIIAAPCAAALINCSHEIVSLLLGPKWEIAANVFWWFGFAIFCKPLGCHIYWIFVACGKMKEMLHWTLVNTLLFLCAVALGLPKGVVHIAAYFSLFEIVFQIPAAIFFLGKTKIISAKEWYYIYIYGLGLFLLLFLCYNLIVGKLQENGTSPLLVTAIALISAAVISILLLFLLSDLRQQWLKMLKT